MKARSPNIIMPSLSRTKTCKHCHRLISGRWGESCPRADASRRRKVDEAARRRKYRVIRCRRRSRSRHPPSESSLSPASKLEKKSDDAPERCGEPVGRSGHHIQSRHNEIMQTAATQQQRVATAADLRRLSVPQPEPARFVDNNFHFPVRAFVSGVEYVAESSNHHENITTTRDKIRL